MLNYLIQYFCRPKSWRDVTVQDVIRRNTERALRNEKLKVRKAIHSLEAIIAHVADASKEWNPDTERLALGIAIEAENAIRELQGDLKCAYV